MRILFLTQILPYPLDAGPKIRAYYVLRHLAQTHEVTLISFVRDSDTPDALAHLRSFCPSVHTVHMPRSPLLDAMHLGRSLVNGQPFIIARDRVKEMAELITNLVTNEPPFDAIHADQLWMAPYATLAKGSSQSNPKPRLVMDQHNAVYMIPKRLGAEENNPVKRLLLALEARKMAHFEVETCLACDEVAWVTREDYDAVQAIADFKHEAVPNSGIIPICGDVTSKQRLPRGATPKRVTFLGGLHYPPNAQGICWYAQYAFPKVLAQYPDALLTVIGKDPPDALHHMGIPTKNLEVTGFADDPEPYLRETAAFVVPLKAGGGMRVKILDAWMWGLPIVSTTIGAEGIDILPGENILIADEPSTLADATLCLLQQPDMAKRIANAGRTWAEERYNWRTVYQAWDRIYA